MSQPPEQLGYAARGRLARPVTDRRERSVGRRLTIGALAFIGYRLAGVLAVGLVLTGIWYGIAPGVAILAGVAIFVLIPAVAGMMRQIRRRRATVILAYLEQAARLNLPLPRMLDAAQQSETGKTSRRLRRLRDLLEDGASVDLALAAAAPEVPRRVVSLIAAGERLGRLRPALERIVRDDRDDAATDDARPVRDVMSRWYPVLMVLVLALMVSFVMIFVVPKLEDIFRDFGLRLPYASRVMIDVSRAFINSDVLPWAALFLAVMALGGTFRRVFTDGREVGRFDLLDHLRWWVPVSHGLERDAGLADGCRVMADALATGRSLPRAIDEAAELDVNAVLRGRLRQWRKGVEGGQPADEAARRARLPGLLAGIIGPGKGGDPTAAMEFLAAYYGGRFSRSREFLRAAAGPLIVFAFGGIVLLLVAGMYQPIINLMDALSAGAVGRWR